MSPETDLEYLRAGRDFLATRPWVQGDYAIRKQLPEGLAIGQDMVNWLNDVDNFEGFCLIGAMFYANRSFEDSDGVLGAAHDRCGRLFERVLPMGSAVAAWNDAPGRTKDEVMKAIDQAIALLENAG